MEICMICVLIENVSDVRIAMASRYYKYCRKERNIHIKKHTHKKKEKKNCVNIVLQE